MAGGSGHAGPMRIMTWNLWWKFGPWSERQAAIESEVERVDPDIFLAQEVFAETGAEAAATTETVAAGAPVDQAQRLANRFGYHYLRSTDAYGRPLSFGNAIFSRWPLAPAAQIQLPDATGEPGFRTMIAAWVDAPSGSQLVATTHLEWDYAATVLRQRQLEAVVECLAGLTGDRGTGREPNPAPPPIIGGDFNAVPSSDEIRRLTGEARPYVDNYIFTDAWAAVGAGPGLTWTRDNPHASQAVNPRRRLDYVLVGWPRMRPGSNPLAARLAGRDPVAGMVPSDHYAVVVDLDDRRNDQP